MNSVRTLLSTYGTNRVVNWIVYSWVSILSLVDGIITVVPFHPNPGFAAKDGGISSPLLTKNVCESERERERERNMSRRFLLRAIG
jgi:hypothetical protein